MCRISTTLSLAVVHEQSYQSNMIICYRVRLFVDVDVEDGDIDTVPTF